MAGSQEQRPEEEGLCTSTRLPPQPLTRLGLSTVANSCPQASLIQIVPPWVLHCVKLTFNTYHHRAGDMALRLRVLTGLAKTLSSIPSIHTG